MKRHLTIALTMTLTAVSAANAVNISNLQAGQLHAAEIDANETSLTVAGQMNAADFAYILDNLNELKSLNISSIEIVGYNGPALPYTGIKTSPEATLPDYALTGLTNLTTIALPDGLKAIGKGSLSGTGISELRVPNTVTSIGDYAAMRCENLQMIIIPRTVRSIGTRAFAYCPKLTTVEIAASLTSIPEGLFEACGGLMELSLSALTDCTDIGPWAIADCAGLHTLVLPESSKAIQAGAFYGASGVQTLTLPESLNHIGNNAMSAMTGLTTIDATDVYYVPTLGENVWSRIDQSKVTLITPTDLVEDYKDSAQWENFHIVSQKDWEGSTENIASSVNGAELQISVADGKIILTSSKPMGRIAVFDVSGRRIVSARAEMNAEIPVNGWASGVYLIATEVGASKITL